MKKFLKSIANFFKNLRVIDPAYSGIIPDPRSPEKKAKDKVAGTASALPVVPRLPSGDWSEYQCATEPQSDPYVFDTNSCATFSAGEDLEEQIIWLLVNKKVPQGIINRMTELGFFRNPIDVRSFKISKRFSAIMNETMPQGNYFWKVADSYRNIGFIPDTMLPFGGKSWTQYMDRSKITNEMILVAREMLSYFKTFYEFVPLNTADGINWEELTQVRELLKATPIQIAIPSPATHAQLLQAVVSDSRFRILDTYAPFDILRVVDNPRIDYAMRYYVIALDAVPVSLVRNLYFGMKGDDVAIVQRFLKLKDDGVFGAITKQAIMNFQKTYSLTVDGIWGNQCRSKMRELA